jgi:hypothetical protein
MARTSPQTPFEQAESILTSRILEVIASRARRMKLGLIANRPLAAHGRFDYEFVMEISENVPIRIDAGTLFFGTLEEELVSFLQRGGTIGGQWGKLVLRNRTIEFDLPESEPQPEPT